MNKFILIPYHQYTSFKSHLMKKDHNFLLISKRERFLLIGRMLEKLSIATKSIFLEILKKDPLDPKDSSRDTLDENNK